MQPSLFLRAPLARSAARVPGSVGLRPLARVSPVSSAMAGQGQMMKLGQRRWETQDNRGGKSKLIFRFGLKDLPVEVYPMLFVVAVACVGGAFAVGRHFYLDGFRLGPGTGRAQSRQETKYE